jgi:hypothetical protein
VVVEVQTSCFGGPACLLPSSEMPSRRLSKSPPFLLIWRWTNVTAGLRNRSC